MSHTKQMVMMILDSEPHTIHAKSITEAETRMEREEQTDGKRSTRSIRKDGIQKEKINT